MSLAQRSDRDALRDDQPPVDRLIADLAARAERAEDGLASLASAYGEVLAAVFGDAVEGKQHSDMLAEIQRFRLATDRIEPCLTCRQDKHLMRRCMSAVCVAARKDRQRQRLRRDARGGAA